LRTFLVTLQGDRAPNVTLTLAEAGKKSSGPLRPSAVR
jgi:hypothetical protein